MLVALGVPADAAAEVDHHGDDPLRDRWHITRAGLGHEHSVRAGRGDVDGADVDRAANEGVQLRQLAEQGLGAGRCR